MNLTTDFAAFVAATYPADTLDPAKKTPAWIRQSAAAGLSEFHRNQANYRLWAHDPDVAEHLAYALGEQSTGRYRRLAGSTGTGLDANSIEVSNRDGWFEDGAGGPGTGAYHRHGSGAAGATDPMGLDSIVKAQPLPLLPVKLRGLKAIITQNGYVASFTALGRKAEADAQAHEAQVRMWMSVPDELERLGATPGPGLPDPLPQSEAELRTYLDEWQVGAAADLERKVLICAEESGMNQLMSEVINDLLCHGYAALADEQLPGRRPRSLRILPHRGLFLPSAYPDGRDQRQGGYLHTLPLSELLAEIEDNADTCNAEGKPWTKDDHTRLRELAAAQLPEGLRGGGVENRPETGALTVVRWYFLGDEKRAWKVRNDEQGNVRTKRIKQADYQLTGNGKLVERPISCLYEATLVQGTGLAYNCRRAYDQGRDLHDPLKARLPFSLIVPDGAPSGRAVSLVRHARGIVDEIERSWRGYMADMRTYVPEGYNVSMKTLEAMAQTMKVGGENPEMEVYRFFRQTGDTFGDAYDPTNNQQLGAPVLKNPGGIPASAAAHLSNLFQQLQLLEAVTGANAVVSAATPGAEAGKGVNQLALQGAANVMAGLRDGAQRLFEHHVRNVAGRIWLTEKNVPVVGALPTRSGGTRAVGPRPDLHEYDFFMKVSPAPTEAEWQQLYGKAAQASANGQITVADEMMLVELENLKTARRYLAMAVTRKARQDEQKALGLQKANGDVQTQTAQAAAEAQQGTLKVQHGLEMERLAFSRDTSWGAIDRQTNAQREVAQANNATREAVAEIAVVGGMQADEASDLRAHLHDAGKVLFAAATAPQPTAPAPATLPAPPPAALPPAALAPEQMMGAAPEQLNPNPNQFAV